MRGPSPKLLVGLAVAVAAAGLAGLVLHERGSDERASTGARPLSGSSPARLAGDGRFFGYIDAANAKPATIHFDVAQFFYGASVQDAAETDRVVRPGEPVSNDHYERNSAQAARTLRLAPDVQVTASAPVTRLLAKPGARPTLDEFVAAFGRRPDRLSATGGPFWVTIRDGVVTRIDEQYFP